MEISHELYQAGASVTISSRSVSNYIKQEGQHQNSSSSSSSSSRSRSTTTKQQQRSHGVSHSVSAYKVAGFHAFDRNRVTAFLRGIILVAKTLKTTLKVPAETASGPTPGAPTQKIVRYKSPAPPLGRTAPHGVTSVQNHRRHRPR
jgi:hypothetical protein